MDKLAILALLEAKTGKEQEVEEFLKVGSTAGTGGNRNDQLVRAQNRCGEVRHFRYICRCKRARCHLSGEIAKALFAKAEVTCGSELGEYAECRSAKG